MKYLTNILLALLISSCSVTVYQIRCIEEKECCEQQQGQDDERILEYYKLPDYEIEFNNTDSPLLNKLDTIFTDSTKLIWEN